MDIENKNQPPAELKPAVQRLKPQVVKEASEKGKVFYDNKNLLLVDRLVGGHETFSNIELTLRPGDYTTYQATRRAFALDPTLRERYRVNPCQVVDPRVPLPIGTAIHVIVGRPPKLIVVPRPPHVADAVGFYTCCAQGYAELDQDLISLGNSDHYSYIRNMTRELREERKLTVINPMESIKPIALIYAHDRLTFNIVGYVYLPDKRPEDVLQFVPKANEGKPEALDFPAVAGQDNEALKDLCRHLLHNPWVEEAAIGLILLLQRIHGDERVLKYLWQAEPRDP